MCEANRAFTMVYKGCIQVLISIGIARSIALFMSLSRSLKSGLYRNFNFISDGICTITCNDQAITIVTASPITPKVLPNIKKYAIIAIFETRLIMAGMLYSP